MATRSRAGCAGCLKQHKKCDEDRPSCGRCSRLGVQCEYNRELRWFNGAQLPRARTKTRLVLTAQDVPRQRPSTNSPESDHQVDSDLEASPLRSPGDASPTCAAVTNGDSGADACPALQDPCPATPDSLSQIFAANAWDDLFVMDDEPTVGAWAVSAPQVGFQCVPDAIFDTGMQTLLFQDAGRQMAFTYFVQHVSSLLSARGAGLRNGYREIAAFSLSSPMFLDTIISVATAYMDRRGIVAKSLSLNRQSRALASLRKSVSVLEGPKGLAADAACLKREVLATVLLQITIEIANGTPGIRSHITYAARLLRELGYDTSEPSSTVSIVLVQRFTFVDVLSSIFWQARPVLSPSFWLFHKEDGISEDSIPTIQETTGCPLRILAILARISHLAADVTDGVSRDVIMTEAREIEGDLFIFARDNMGALPSAYDEESRHLELLARCYYWNACILLQRRVFDDLHTSNRVQHCLERLIELLDSLPTGCGPDTQLSLPLYVAALVAVRQDHRDFLRDKSCDLERQYPMETRTILTGAFDAIWATTDNLVGSVPAHASCTMFETADPMKDKQFFIC